MRIQHNILAMNAYRNYNTNTSALSKNLEKLSSGYKINRAGDDAAGLAISEKMRAQITGLNAASKNVKDGISLVKTAEGAMQEIQDMLNRMDYLATQSANGTYQDEVDRENLNKEMSALKTEINRIADSANFNGIKLLDGSLDTAKLAQDAVTETVTIDPTKSEALTFENGKLAEVGQVLGTNTVLHNEANGSTGTRFSVDLHNFKFQGGKGNTLTMKMGDTEITLKATEDHGQVEGADLVDAFLGANGYEITVDGKKVDTLDGMQINGQTMEVKAGAENTSRLTFTQKEAPASKADEINGSMQVTISGKVEPKKAEFTFNAADLGNTTIGGVVTINGQSYTIKDKDTTGAAPTAQSWSEVFADMEKQGILSDYKVTEDGGKVTLTAKEAGKMNTPTVSYKETQAATGITGNQVAGVDGVKSKYTTGALTASGAVTADEVATLTVNYTDAAGKAQTKNVSYTLTGTDTVTTAAGKLIDALKADKDLSNLFDISGSNAGIILEAKEMGTGKGAVTGITLGGDAATGTTKLALGTGTAVNAVDAVKNTWTYDVTGWNDSALGPVTLEDAGGNKLEIDFDKLNAAGERGLKVGEYIATLDGNTLTLTAQKAGNSSGQGPTANGTLTNAISYNTYKAPVKLTEAQIDVVKEGAEGGKMEGITEGAHGDFNVSTTAIKNVTAGGADRLASTYFDLTEDMVKDGATIKIGEDEFTFTTDPKKIGTAGNVTFVDASSGDLAAIAKNLTEAAKGNAVWTVGHDGNRITLTETKTHGDLDTNQTLEDYRNNANTKFDLSTKEGIEQSLSFIGAGSYEKENVISEATEGGKALNLQIGDTSDAFNQMKVSIGDMHVSAMKLTDEETGESTSIEDIDILTSDNAQKAVDVIKNAINYVSGIRGDLGAYQNRLEHTANNLSVMAENIQDAESTIRDTDIAEEMMSYTKNNILVQSAQAMLAQANAVPQGVLQLLG